jgi:15-cis-phytoene desaturase
MYTDVLIIGGGIAGLACGVGLSGSGLRVTVVEQSAELGGRARSWVDRETGDVIDIGPHILLSEYRNMLRLLEILGTRDRITWREDRFITLFEPPHAVPIRMGRLPAPLHFVRSILATPTISVSDANSNARTTWTAMRLTEDDVQRLDGIAADDFLRSQGVTRRFRDWFWASTAMSIMNVPLERCSTGALLRFYQILLGHNDLRMGFPAVGLSELYVPQAVRRIESDGGRVLLKSGVKRLTGADGLVHGAILADGTPLHARWIVSAVPPHSLREMLPFDWSERDSEFGDLGAFEPSPYVSTYLWFDRKLTREPSWARVWSPKRLNYDSYDLSNIRIGWETRPSVIASNIIYSHGAQAMSDEAIVETTVREIAEYLPEAARARVLHARVHRIPMAIHCPYPGTERRRPPTRSALAGLFLAGDWTRTGFPACMESAVRSGSLAAEQVLEDAGRPRRVALELNGPEGITGLVQRLPRAD